MDVVLHKADRETKQIIPAEPVCGTSVGHAKRSHKKAHHYRNCLGGGRNPIPERVPQSNSNERPLGRSPPGAGRTASRGLGAGGKQHFVFDLLRRFRIIPR